MIFYFTGTGNSLWVAEALGKALKEPLVAIADELKAYPKELMYPLDRKSVV